MMYNMPQKIVYKNLTLLYKGAVNKWVKWNEKCVELRVFTGLPFSCLESPDVMELLNGAL